MSYKFFVLWLISLLVKLVLGDNCTYTRTIQQTAHRDCGLFGWASCTYQKYLIEYYSDCCRGWTGYQCETPICSTPCYNGGTCVGPEQCKCPTTHYGQYCTTLLCSSKAPCFPGTCSFPSKCDCFKGFNDSTSGCLTFSADNHPPSIQKCELTLANIRRIDRKQLLYFSVPCVIGASKDTVWCNQEMFNYAKFSMASHYSPLVYPLPPSYVRSHSFGIVYSGMLVTHTKFPRPADFRRYEALNKTYHCPAFSDDRPNTLSAECSLEEENYKISIEHDDIFTVTYITKNGGFRQLYDSDNYRYLPNQYYKGQTSTKTIEFKFDFVAPIHCSEINASSRCLRGEKPIDLKQDITKSPLQPTWNGWSDDLSGLAYYYLEIFELQPNIHNELTELHPLKPIFTFRTNRTSNIDFPAFTPLDSGMYSILLQASDRANNSKIARRLVLYDKSSRITLTKPGFVVGQAINVTDLQIGDGGMHVVTALRETGYMWQNSKNNGSTHIILDWQNHFVNQVIDKKKLLSAVLPYPTQFTDLQDDGVLRSKKYVSLDDNEGLRTRQPINNVHGIVKFEINRVYTDNREEPRIGWVALGNLSERFEFWEELADGSHVRLWVRATDIMNNTLSDYTEVHFDNTPPRVDDVVWTLNVSNGSFAHTSRLQFLATDQQSGVHWIEYSLYVGNNSEKHSTGGAPAKQNNVTNACVKDPKCICVLGTCFLGVQTLDIDNCMFLVLKEDLNKTGRIDVKVFNQALLFKEFSVQINCLSDLEGLEKYSGPSNIRVEKKLPTGVRLKWDLPKTTSCYGRASIQVAIIDSTGTVNVINLSDDETSVDVVGLNPDQDYSVSMKLGYRGTELATMQPFAFKTAAHESHVDFRVFVGTAVGAGVIIFLLAVVFVVLLKRGHMEPVRRGLAAVSMKLRITNASVSSQRMSSEYDNYAINRDSLFVYGEMDSKYIQSWNIERDNVILQSMLKSGSFADVYLARLRSSNTTVVAKTLKDKYSKGDELLMKANIHFSAMEVGSHENVLKFIGAVCEDWDIGPFIIYEYCSKGPLRDYLESIKAPVPMATSELILAFGLGIAKGMEYLAERKIVHRRLAAHNILLDEKYEVKIAGIGPRTNFSVDGEQYDNKQEHIPVKWMSPECIETSEEATEKSDVWSFGIVLWEIFTLGDIPYSNIRDQEVLGQLMSGYRLPMPKQCDDKWYGVMQRSWETDPEKRPNFKQIHSELDVMFASAHKE